MGWESHRSWQKRLPSSPPATSSLNDAQVSLCLRSPGFCHLALVGKEELLLQALYYSREDNGAVSLGPFECLSQYERDRDQYGICLRSRGTGRNPGEGEKGEPLTLNMLREA